MPLYDYKCKSCNSSSEVFQKISEDKLTTCEKCGGVLVRIIGKTSFQLKGGGWESDGYSTKPPPPTE